MPAGPNSAVVERHFKKIHDCLNIACNKKAVQEIDRLPKNIKDLPLFKALKALALIRMHKRTQALEVLDEIMIDGDLDEGTLRTMTSCYIGSLDVAKIVELYEVAAQKRPDDQDIMIHLFIAHVRVFNYKRQKEIAMQMFKTFQKDKRHYTFWAITSLVLQAEDAAEDSIDKKICLQLAEKMCEKMLDDEKSHEEVELYLTILRKQKKHEEEYKFIFGPAYSKVCDHLSWVFRRRAAYLCLELNMHLRAFKYYFPALIAQHPDQLEYYDSLIDCAFKLDTDYSAPATIAGDQTANNAVKPACALYEAFEMIEKNGMLEHMMDNFKRALDDQMTPSIGNTKKICVRAPFIARIRLLHLLRNRLNTLPASCQETCKSLVEKHRFPDILAYYYVTHGGKLICFYDMEMMIKDFDLSSEQRLELMQIIKQHKDNKGIDGSQPSINSRCPLYRDLNYHMLDHSLHNYQVDDAKQDRLTIARRYIDEYNNYLGQASKAATSTNDFLLIDNYCILAINAIMTNVMNRHATTGSATLTDSMLFSLIVMAEGAIANSPSNHQVKLILLKLYSLIGTSDLCANLLTSLDIKHFQIDTLGHLLNPVLYHTGHYTLSKDSLDTCLEFYAHGVREIFEALTLSYRDGRYSKIEEVGQVLKRLNNSLNAAQCVLLKSIVANVVASNNDEMSNAQQAFDTFKNVHQILQSKDCSKLIQDNRDFKVLRSLHLDTSQLLVDRQKQTFDDDCLWLRLRYILMRSVYIQTDLSNRFAQMKKAERDKLCSELDQNKADFELAMVEIANKLTANESNDVRYSFLEPEASPFRWPHLNYQRLIDLVRPLVFLHDSTGITQADQASYNNLLESIVANLEQILLNVSSMIAMRNTLCVLTLSFEFISVAITSLLALSGINQTCTQTSKANQQQPQASKQKSSPHTLLHKTETQLIRLSNAIKMLDPKSIFTDKLVLDLEMCNDRDDKYTTEYDHVLRPLLGRQVSSIDAVHDEFILSYIYAKATNTFITS